jgi:hypothetical protein
LEPYQSLTYKPWAFLIENILNNGYKSQVQPILSLKTTMTQLDPNFNADLLDAMADMAYQQEQAMREEYEIKSELTEDYYDDQT